MHHSRSSSIAMAGLVPGLVPVIHVCGAKEDVGARDKAGMTGEQFQRRLHWPELQQRAFDDRDLFA
jgi:hypothetical protein